MKNIFAALICVSVAACGLARTYYTQFPATENPISQSSIWTNGAATGLDWQNVRTTPGLAFGTQTGSGGTDDSTAILTGTWGATQTAQATVRATNQQTGSIFEEVELRLRSTMTAHSCTGYEVIFSAKSSSDALRYVQIVRWDGAFNTYTLLDGTTGPGLANGDVVKATISGTTITAYINGTSILSATDATYSTGNPGIGFYLQTGASTLNPDFGFTDFLATDGTLRSTNGSQSDVASKISAASDGDVILLPAGSFTWTSGVTVSGKGIKIQGAGAGRVVARSLTSNTIGTGTKTFTLITENLSGIAALRSALANGATVKIYRTGGEVSGGALTGNIPWMRGTVTSLSGNTLTMNITSTNGSGTHPVWFVATEAATTLVMNAASTDLMAVTQDTTHNVDISGIRFEHDPSLSTDVDHSANFINITDTSGGKSVFIHDCTFWNHTYGDQIRTTSNRGVIWACSFVSLPYSMAPLAWHVKGAPAASWTTTSTMGTADSTGESNTYMEDCDFHGWLNATDFDDCARAVVRYTLFDNAAIGSHGADSSNYGLRHFEAYHDDFVRSDFSTGQTLDLVTFFLLRGGTGVITDCWIPALGGSDYGSAPNIKLALWNLQGNFGPNPLWGNNIVGIQWPAPREIGRGYTTGTGTDGTGRTSDTITKVGDSEPLMIWNNTGSYTISLSEFSSPVAGEDVIADYIQAGRDYFNDGTAKSGYAEYTYPHPLRPAGDSGGGAGGGDTTAPVVTITTPTSSPTYSTSTTPLTTLAGTASDDVALSSVTWSNSAGGSGTATGTPSWSVASITLSSGSNIITVTATDTSSNTSTDTLTITYTPPATATPTNYRKPRTLAGGGL